MEAEQKAHEAKLVSEIDQLVEDFLIKKDVVESGGLDESLYSFVDDTSLRERVNAATSKKIELLHCKNRDVKTLCFELHKRLQNFLASVVDTFKFLPKGYPVFEPTEFKLPDFYSLKPETYIDNCETYIKVYKEIYSDVADYLLNVFGDLPRNALVLLKICEIFGPELEGIPKGTELEDYSRFADVEKFVTTMGIYPVYSVIEKKNKEYFDLCNKEQIIEILPGLHSRSPASETSLKIVKVRIVSDKNSSDLQYASLHLEFMGKSIFIEERLNLLEVELVNMNKKIDKLRFLLVRSIYPDSDKRKTAATKIKEMKDIIERKKKEIATLELAIGLFLNARLTFENYKFFNEKIKGELCLLENHVNY
jgi:hypothetical protein